MIVGACTIGKRVYLVVERYIGGKIIRKLEAV